MRISHLAATSLILSFSAISPEAFASCNTMGCQPYAGLSSGQSYTGTLQSYRSTTGAAYAPLGSYGGGSYAGGSYAGGNYGRQSGWMSAGAVRPTSTVVPFSTTTTNISKHRIAGLGDNEVLTPTNCPVSVYNPEGGKVLGCYAVGKIATGTRRQAHVQAYAQAQAHVQARVNVRIVRPVIYVRYPVPVPVYRPAPVYRGCNVRYSTRYGQSWPGRPCG